jgi:hypothetical protein
VSASVSCAVGAALSAASMQVTAFSEATMRSTVRITRSNLSGTLNYDTGLVDDPSVVIYEGKARISQVRGGSPMLLGDEQEFFSTVSVAIPLSAPQVIIDDTVEILSGPDPHVVNRMFRVTDTEGGGDLPADQVFNALGVARSRTNS